MRLLATSLGGEETKGLVPGSSVFKANLNLKARLGMDVLLRRTPLKAPSGGVEVLLRGTRPGVKSLLRVEALIRGYPGNPARCGVLNRHGFLCIVQGFSLQPLERKGVCQFDSMGISNSSLAPEIWLVQEFRVGDVKLRVVRLGWLWTDREKQKKSYSVIVGVCAELSGFRFCAFSSGS